MKPGKPNMKILFLGGIDIGLLNKMVSGQLPPPSEENCPPVRVGVWVRVIFGVGGQFTSVAVVLEPNKIMLSPMY